MTIRYKVCTEQAADRHTNNFFLEKVFCNRTNMLSGPQETLYWFYKLDPTDLSSENDQNPTFRHFGSFKNGF